MSNILDYIKKYIILCFTSPYFLIGGLIVSGIKFASENIPNLAVAAIIGGIPTGFLAISFLARNKKLDYAKNYYFVTLSLLAAIFTYYILSKYNHYNLSENFIYGLSWCVWIAGISLKLFLNK